MRHPACICDCQGKIHVYALKQGQERDKSLKNQTHSEQEMSSNVMKTTTIEMRAM
jgi:hypothetical protein